MSRLRVRPDSDLAGSDCYPHAGGPPAGLTDCRIHYIIHRHASGRSGRRRRTVSEPVTRAGLGCVNLELSHFIVSGCRGTPAPPGPAAHYGPGTVTVMVPGPSLSPRSRPGSGSPP